MENLNLDVSASTNSRNDYVARYSDSTITHIFNLKGISSLYDEELQELLETESVWNGSFSLKSYNFRTYSVVYETTDSYEANEDVAEEIEVTISNAIRILAEKKGGMDAIKA